MQAQPASGRRLHAGGDQGSICLSILRILQRFRQQLPARIVLQNGLELIYDGGFETEGFHRSVQYMY